jgi:hypothetical protein
VLLQLFSHYCICDVEALLSLTNNPGVTKLPIVFTYTVFEGAVGPFPRLASLCHEPSFLGYFLAPAVCMYLGKIIIPELTDDSLDVLNNKFEVNYFGCLHYDLFIGGIFWLSNYAYYFVVAKRFFFQ